MIDGATEAADRLLRGHGFDLDATPPEEWAETDETAKARGWDLEVRSGASFFPAGFCSPRVLP